MTTEPPAREFQLHRRERRAIPPFGDGANPNRVSQLLGSALESCRFAPFPDVPLTDERTYFLKEHEQDRNLEPRFAFAPDNIERVADSVGATLNDLSLIVSARVRHIKRYLPLKEWALNAVPKEWRHKPQELVRLQSRSDISFIVAIRVTADRPAVRENGLDRGKVLSRREFVVKKPSDLSFPIEWIDFQETDYPDEMLWVVRWKDPEDHDFALPVHETLTVWVNKRADQPLQRISQVPQGGDLAWKMLAAEITTEIWHRVVTTIEDAPVVEDTESLGGQVFTRLAHSSGMEYYNLMDIVKEAEDSRTEIRSHVARVLKVVA